MASKASLDDVISHWSTLTENLQASPLQFYQSVETAIRRRQVPETKNARVDYKESSILSAKREYLRVSRERLVLDICAAPFGTGFFFSWWLAEPKPRIDPIIAAFVLAALLGGCGLIIENVGVLVGLLVIGVALLLVLWLTSTATAAGELSDDFVRALPFIGAIYERLFRPATYYRLDTTEMFQTAVHNAVLEVIDEMTTTKGLRALSEMDRKPVMREFYKRKAS